MIVVEVAALALGAFAIDGQLEEDEGADRREDQHRHDRPEDLEAGRAVDLEPVGRSGPLAAPVLGDQHDQGALDADEDDRGEDEHEDVRLADVVRVRRMRCSGSSAPVASERRTGERERARARDTEYEGFPTHAFGIV